MAIARRRAIGKATRSIFRISGEGDIVLHLGFFAARSAKPYGRDLVGFQVGGAVRGARYIMYAGPHTHSPAAGA